jgi:hypothetical protein
MSRLTRWLLCGCSVLMVMSCGSGRTARADETTPATDASDVSLVDLQNAGAVAAWTTVNDPVMGGRSTSGVAFADGGLVFSGTISLDNNGGFASARSPQDPGIGRKAAGASSLRVRAVGDGKTYLLKVGQAGRPWSYIQRFRTDAGVARTYDLPVDGFEAVGKRLDPAPDAPRTPDPASIDQVAVYILDEQQGPFALTLSAIDASRLP